MNKFVLLVLCLVTLSNVQLGQSQCDVVRVTAAVYEALGSILDEMSQRFGNTLDSIRDDLIQNLTEQIINNARNTCGVIGWRRAVYLDMTDSNTNCPSGWNMTRYSKRSCGRASTERRSCDSVIFPVSGGPYSQVCGRIRAYQWGGPDGFVGYRHGLITIGSAYFDGVVVMHGSPRKHIWTFAVGRGENGGTYGGLCPCDTSADIPIPPFVGEDYFCESGFVRSTPGPLYVLHSNDILWDGRDCHPNSTCCSLHNPPYFTKTLSQTTTDDLDLRMCFFYSQRRGNTAVELVELYVK